MDILGSIGSALGITPASPPPSTPAISLSGGTQSWGASILSQAQTLGRQFDAGVHTVGAWVDKHIDATVKSADEGIKQAAYYAGGKVHEGADAIRSRVTGSDPLSQAVRAHVTASEMTTRAAIGVVAAVPKVAVDLVGTVAKVGSTTTQMALSPTRTQEVVTGLAQGTAHAATAAYDYGKSVVADPGRVGGDAAHAWNSLSAPYKQAINEGHGPEAIGMTVGEAATYVIPGVVEARAATTAVRAGEAVADTAKALEATGTLTRAATETAGKVGTEAVAKTGAETAAKAGTETVAREGAEATAKGSGETAAKTADGTAARTAETAPPRQRIEMDAGKKGDWPAELNAKTLKPNTDYVVNGHTYATDAKGRVVTAEAKVELKTADRNAYQQKVSGRADRLPDDQGGHLIASIFNGPGDRLNMVPMNGNLNQGAWKAMENRLAAAAQDGKSVEMKIDVIYKDDSTRPEGLVARSKIDGVETVDSFPNKAGGR